MTSSSLNNWIEYSIDWQLPENGILQILTTNGSDVAVYFDELSVRLQETMIVQETHYYPFGGVLKGIGKEGNNKYLYNGGTEREDSFDIGLDETDFRRYDANLGRFTGIDALAEMYQPLTPYHYAFNNPINNNDPSGLEPESLVSSFDIDSYQQNIRNEIQGRFDRAMFEMEKRIEGRKNIEAKGGGKKVVNISASGPCVECKKALPNAKKGDRYTVNIGTGNTEHFVYEYDGKTWNIKDFYKTPADGAVNPDYSIEEIFISPLRVARNILSDIEKDDGFTQEDYFNDAVDRDFYRLGLKLEFGTTRVVSGKKGTPNSIYTYLDSKMEKAVSNYLYNSDGDVFFQVDFGSHGKNYPSGHGHKMSKPGILGDGHLPQNHISVEKVRLGYFKIPNQVIYSVPIGKHK
jgi:RHS repeat-associated protein